MAVLERHGKIIVELDTRLQQAKVPIIGREVIKTVQGTISGVTLKGWSGGAANREI